MDKYKQPMGNFHHQFCVVAVLLAAIGTGLSQTTESVPDVRFVIEPFDLCLHFYSEPVQPPVFYCNIDGLTDEMEVVWLRNDRVIQPEEYESANYTLLGNYTNGAYDLKILRTIMRSDDRSKYSCAVFLLTNASQNLEQTLLKQSRTAKLRVNFYVPEKFYPECSISLTPSSTSSPSVEAAPYKEGTGFTIVCCSETLNPEMELIWYRENSKGKLQVAGMNVSRKSEKDKDACLMYDVINHMTGDSYSCQLTIPRVLKRFSCRKQFKNARMENGTTYQYLDTQRRKCSFRDRGINLVKQDVESVDNDVTFTCFSTGAIEYLWEFKPSLDKSKNQYHVSKDRATVLLNLDSLSERQYNITCTAMGEDSLGSRSLIIEISQTDTTVQNIIQIVAISLGALVVLTLILLVIYAIKTRLLNLCKNNHTRGLSPQEMRARIQIRRNMSGNSGGLYSFPSSRMASSSITPLMEGPEDTVSTTEREHPPSPMPPRPGLLRPASHLAHLQIQGAVGGVILDEDEMVECEYRDEEFECDPKSMNVEGLQYADLEFSEDEEYIKDQDSDEESESGDEEGDTKEKGATAGKRRIDYADIVHFDPRKNTDPRRNSDQCRNSETRRNSADPWRKM